MPRKRVLRTEAIARLDASAPIRTSRVLRWFWYSTLPASLIASLDAWAFLPTYFSLVVSQVAFWCVLTPVARAFAQAAAQTVF